MIDLKTCKSDISLRFHPDCFSKGCVIHTIYSHWCSTSVLSHTEVLLTGESLFPEMQWIQSLCLNLSEINVRISDVICGVRVIKWVQSLTWTCYLCDKALSLFEGNTMKHFIFKLAIEYTIILLNMIGIRWMIKRSQHNSCWPLRET